MVDSALNCGAVIGGGMWLLVSLACCVVGIAVLGAGLLWPWARAQETAESSAPWYHPWRQLWVQICLPFLSWRYRWYLQRLLSFKNTDTVSLERFFARQCLIFLMVFLVGAGWLLLANQAPSLLLVCLVGASLGFSLPVLQLKQEKTQLKKQMQRDFPFMLDLLCLSIESGHGLQQALWLCSAELAEGALRRHLVQVQEAMRAGMSREHAFQQFAEQVDLDEAQAFVAALQQSIELGGRLAPMLKQQAQQRRQERFLRAEKQALEAPVKMLLPLVVCIFPCTFLVIAYPLFFQLWQQL